MEKENQCKTPEELFKKLVQLNVNEHTELKNDLTYLSWAWAWQEFKKVCPDATYEIKKFKNEVTGRILPFMEDENLGYMVWTEITACGQTHEMWLPVMDNNNKSMKKSAYKYTTKSGEKTVMAATMFDINKTIMRCLVKNIAMFGLGLYIYAGEDLPIELGEPCTQAQIDKIKELKVNEANVLKRYKIESIDKLTYQQAEFIINTKIKTLEKEKGVTQ